MIQVKIGEQVIGEAPVRVCMPLSPRHSGELSEELDYINDKVCDIFEWRVDYWQGRFDFAVVIEKIKKAIKEKPCLFTYRTAIEGGRGSNDFDEYYNINSAAVASGRIELLDVEATKEPALIERLIKLSHENDVKVIISKHVFDRCFSKREIIETLCEMQELHGDIVKLAVSVNDEAAAKEIMEAAKEMFAEHAKMPFVTIGMGEFGKITRYPKPFYGSAITYVKGLKATASGQLSLDECLC